MIERSDFFIELLTKTTLVLAAAWAISFGIRNNNPQWRILLWRIAAIGLLILPASISMNDFPFWGKSESPALNNFPQESQNNVPLYQPILEGSPVYKTVTIEDIQSNVRNEEKAYSQRSTNVSGENLLLSYSFCLLVWLSVALALLVRSSVLWIRGRSLQIDSTPVAGNIERIFQQVADDLRCRGKISLRSSNRFQIPLIAGWIQPTIIIPQRMVERSYQADWRSIFAHEIAHWQAGDLYWLGSFKLLQSALWFHPLMWFIRSSFHKACEELCDLKASRYIGNASTYSKTLARIALEINQPFSFHGGIAMTKKSKIRTRLECLLKSDSWRPLTKQAVFSIYTICLLCLFFLSSVQLIRSAEPNKECDIQDVLTKLKKAQTEFPPFYYQKLTRSKNRTITKEQPDSDWSYNVDTEYQWSDGNRNHSIHNHWQDEFYHLPLDLMLNSLKSNLPTDERHDLHIGKTRYYFFGNPQQGFPDDCGVLNTTEDENESPFTYQYSVDLVPLWKILHNESGKLSVARNRIMGTDCYLIEGDTSWGDYKVWLDPQHGWQVKRIHLTRDGKDKNWDGRIMGDTTIYPGRNIETDFGYVRAEYIFEALSYENVQGHYFIQETLSTYQNTNVEYKTFMSETETTYLTIQANPDFKAAHAFELPIPEDLISKVKNTRHVRWTEKNYYSLEDVDGNLLTKEYDR